MPTAIHARRRVTAAACPQMSRMNVGHRPAIHSPHRHPSRTAGFRRPRRPFGLRGLLTPCELGPEGRVVGGSRREGSLFGRRHGAAARCGTGTGVPPYGGEPTRETRAILNTGPGDTGTARSEATEVAPNQPGPPPPAATIRGHDRGRGARPGALRRRRATKVCQPLWRGYRPSDATWKQRLGLITLVDIRHVRGGGAPWKRSKVFEIDLVVFRLFFLSFPSYTWQPWCAALAARKCSHL